MTDAAARRTISLCADDYGLSEGVNRAIRDLISCGRLNATSVMVVGAAIGRAEVAALQDVAANSPRCAIGLHATLTAPFRPLTMHFRPLNGGLFLPFPAMLRSGLLRRLDPGLIEDERPVRAWLIQIGRRVLIHAARATRARPLMADDDYHPEPAVDGTLDQPLDQTILLTACSDPPQHVSRS